jgi:hypothetical protein
MAAAARTIAETRKMEKPPSEDIEPFSCGDVAAKQLRLLIGQATLLMFTSERQILRNVRGLLQKEQEAQRMRCD